MDILFFLIPIAVLLACVIVGVFFWAVRSGQFEDLEGPAYRILRDDDSNSLNRRIEQERQD
ncbi:MAG: cbb3-type cytochrome oxidase assembly protein CcoS [Pseudomonadota bacterium]